jgi:hypothetical protein
MQRPPTKFWFEVCSTFKKKVVTLSQEEFAQMVQNVDARDLNCMHPILQKSDKCTSLAYKLNNSRTTMLVLEFNN